MFEKAVHDVRFRLNKFSLFKALLYPKICHNGRTNYPIGNGRYLITGDSVGDEE